MGKLLAIGFMLLSIVTLPGCGSAQAVNPEEVVVGNTIPDFSVTSLEGKTIDKNALKGEVVVLNFWASWCTPCMAEIPELKELAANSKAKVIGIALDENGLETVKPFVDAHRINYTVAVGTQELFQQFNGVGIPYTLVLDPSQRIVKIYRGPTNRESLEADLKTIKQNL
ncbi:MAG TPA: TlpA disulfide reductase family protein [Pyrinomonadaceae bacterium]|nr:TlpA disulfide reductase family protein [Pyrinomonadaceae bacterium]